MMILCIDMKNRIREKWIFWKNCKMKFKKSMIEFKMINEAIKVF